MVADGRGRLHWPYNSGCRSLKRGAVAHQAPKSRIVWITSVAAPYRIPVWRALAQWAAFEVALTVPDDRVGISASSNRAADWRSTNYPDVRFIPLRTMRAKWRGRPLYYLLPKSRLRSMRALDAVLIGGWEAPAYWQVLALGKLCGVRTIAFYESTPASHRFQRGPVAAARRFFLKRVDAVVVPGVAARDGLLKMGVAPNKIFVGFNAVDVRHFHEVAERHRRDHGADAPGHRFIYVGQLISRKRVDHILEAFRTTAAEMDSLTIVGIGHEQTKIAELIRDLNLVSQVRVIPGVLNADVPRILSEHHTLVLASDEEVWGLVANEALASGLHVVVSANCGVAPSIQHMRGVHVAMTNRVTDIAAAMAKSRVSWSGPIREPEILKYTPEEFAKVFYQALRPE
jgi:glycosyltransferase involved in cell wall biosynthesis